MVMTVCGVVLMWVLSAPSAGGTSAGVVGTTPTEPGRWDGAPWRGTDCAVGQGVALLQELMRRAAETLKRAHLIEHVWDFAYDGGSNVVDEYVRHLRDKVDRPFGRNTIPTMRGAGYRLDTDA